MNIKPLEDWFVFYFPDKGWCVVGAYGKGDNGYVRSGRIAKELNKLEELPRETKLEEA